MRLEKALVGQLQQIYTATVKNPKSDEQLAKFVKTAESMLQLAVSVDAGAPALFAAFYKSVGLDSAESQGRFIKALASSENLVIRTILASNLQKAIKAQEVYEAPLPRNLESIEIYRSPNAAGGHPRAGRISVLGGLGPKGKGADMFEVPAHIAMVPQQRSTDPKQGGGGRGGVAAWGAAKVAEVTKSLPDEIRQQAIGALDAFEGKLAAAKKPLAAGNGDLAMTGIDDPRIFAAAVFHCPLVPPKNLQLASKVTDEARTSSQAERMRFGQDMLGAALERLAMQATSTFGEPSIASPLVIAMPMLNTGPAALLTEAEAGWVYGNVARAFLDKNPGFEIVFAPFAGYRTSEFAANRDRFIGGLRSIDAPPPEVRQEDVKSPAQLLAQWADTARSRMKVGGATLNLADRDVLAVEIAKLKQQILGALKPGEAGDRYVGGTSVRDAVGAGASEAFWQLHRIAELPAKAQQYTGGGEAKDTDGLVVPTSESIAALLDSEALLFEVQATLKAALGGNDDEIKAPQNLGDLIAIATARTLQQARFDYVNESQKRLTNEVAGADFRVKEILSGVGSKYRTLVDCMQDAQRQLTTALEQGRNAKDAIKDYEAQIKKLLADKSLVQGKLDAKITELANAQRDLAAALQAQRAAASTYSRATSSYSG